MTSKSDEVSVTAADQAKICRFSCLHQHSQELQQEEKVTKDLVQGLKDATDEVLIGGMDSYEANSDLNPLSGTTGRLLVKTGDAYIDLEEDEVLQFLKDWEEDALLESEKNQHQIHENEEEMSSLKKSLYEKFADQIQLET
eukprot:GHVQ01001831.1.p1 GENE.GHVQ01001831.1~~GHVQ01001831.1.p1  ORF type:complete len:141 (-),score=33.35 GHVQ01001831.1:2841-3263(-)